MTTTKLTPALDWMDAPIKSEMWKNLVFLRDGKTVLCPNTHPSEMKAKQMSDIDDDGHEELSSLTGRDVAVADGQGNILWMFSNYSHTIQIPWRQD